MGGNDRGKGERGDRDDRYDRDRGDRGDRGYSDGKGGGDRGYSDGKGGGKDRKGDRAYDDRRGDRRADDRGSDDRRYDDRRDDRKGDGRSDDRRDGRSDDRRDARYDDRRDGRDDRRDGRDDRGKGGKDGRYDDRRDGRDDGKGGKDRDRNGDKGSGEKGKGGEKGKKGKGRPQNVIKQGLRGKIIKFLKNKPGGFIQRTNEPGEDDVYFDNTDIVGVGDEELELYDAVEFDVVEGGGGRCFAARVKKLPKGTLEESKAVLVSAAPIQASAAGSLTGSLTGGITLGPSPGKKAGSLTGGLSLRPGGALSPGGGASGSLTGGLSLRPGGSGAGSKAEPAAPKPSAFGGDGNDEGEVDEDLQWARVVGPKERFGFLKRLGATGGDKEDTFFRASDVVGMNCNEPGEEGKGILVTLPHGRNSCGHLRFWLNTNDEVSYYMSKDHTGKPCAVDIQKERRGAWRSGRRPGQNIMAQGPCLKDQMGRLLSMDADQVLQNVSLFKDVLESPEFNPSHLSQLLTLLAMKELVEDDRADSLYRIFMDSTAMQASLRTTIIKYSSGQHSGDFLEECLRTVVEIVARYPSPQELRGRLPLQALVEAWEASIREGSTATKEGLPEEIKQMLQFLKKKFPDEVDLNRILGSKSRKPAHRTAAQDATELMEADDYRVMPILPTPEEMLGQAAFEIQENMRTYDKCEDYIQTHFMLLREDYVEPLRAGIKLFMEGRHSPKDLHVYTGVQVVGVLSTWEGVVYRVQLPKHQIRRINWEKSKQLMYGSLLCLSDDNFETILWATVWRRDDHLMATEGQLDIRLPFEPFEDYFSPGKSFCCIENVTIYFEAYRWVLLALQAMRPSDVPFQHTLLPPQPEPVPPTFLTAENDMFHFHDVFHSCMKADAPFSAPKSFKVLQDWPDTLLSSLDIDPSQLDAIQHSMTHALALIQGPPGTGKTWVGLKIVQALIENTFTMRQSPILVVCYTNHALDQFLEGIFGFCERIARIGSRSKSEVLKDRNLKEIVGSVQPSREFGHAKRALMERRDKLREEFAKLLDVVEAQTLTHWQVRDFLSERQWNDFYLGYLDHLGDNANKVTDDYEDSDAVDPELWEEMLKAWLETKHPEKFVPAAQRPTGGLPTSAQSELAPEADADDEEEEEGAAEAEKHDRKLDVEQVHDPMQDKQRPGPADFYKELKNPWLPDWEDYASRLTGGLQNLNWKEEVDNLWRLTREEKRETFRQWLIEAHHEAREQLPELARLLERNADSRAALERDRKLEMLREMQVVGMTTTAVSKYQQLLKELRPEIVIVEEAAEVLESHILTALHPRSQHVVLIGDHQQLRPGTAVFRLSKCFHLDVSLFERLINNGAEHVTLLQQRRMHPKVSRLIKPLYPLLRDHWSVSDYPEIKGVDARCFFLRHTKLEDEEGESHSKSNSFEANYIGALCSHLIKSGYEESQITVLSPYLGQVRTLKIRLKRDVTTSSILVTAVDNYQGEENDIIIVSLVRSNRAKAMGFLAVENRINVALTRAKHGMFIVGNADMLRNHDLWKKIMAELAKDGCIAESMPLIDPADGSIFEARSGDDILARLGEPLQDDAGGFGGGRGGFPQDFPVADRWAQLGKDDPPASKGKGRGGGYGEELPRFSGGGQRGRDAPRDGKSDREPDRWVPDGDRVPFSKEHAKSSADSRRGAPDLQEREREFVPPPDKIVADGLGEECELIKPKKEDDEDVGKKAGKKKQKKPQVLMRCG